MVLPRRARPAAFGRPATPKDQPICSFGQAARNATADFRLFGSAARLGNPPDSSRSARQRQPMADSQNSSRYQTEVRWWRSRVGRRTAADADSLSIPTAGADFGLVPYAAISGGGAVQGDIRRRGDLEIVCSGVISISGDGAAVSIFGGRRCCGLDIRRPR